VRPWRRKLSNIKPYKIDTKPFIRILALESTGEALSDIATDIPQYASDGPQVWLSLSLEKISARWLGFQKNARASCSRPLLALGPVTVPYSLGHFTWLSCAPFTLLPARLFFSGR
jgi:hypothetical protein